MPANRTRSASLLLLLLTLLAFTPTILAQTQCWAPREDQDTVTNPKWAPQLRAMLEAEKTIRATPEFLNTPEPVRMRTTVAAGPYDPAGARLLIRAYPEKSTVGIQIWTGKCEVIPQAERVAASIGQVDVFFNYPVTDTFLADGEVPKKTGEVAGYPEYNHWIVITKNGRLPWIPQTLAERLDREGQRRQKKLEEWRKDQASMKAPDETVIRQTYDMLKKSDAAGAESYLASMKDLVVQMKHQRDVEFPATTASLEKSVADYKQYRASFSAEDLQRPAVWAGVSAYTGAEPDLFNFKPGSTDKAMGFKPDPAFPDPKFPTRIQLITVMIPTVDTRKGRDVWSKQTKAAMNYAALARLLE